MSTVRLLLIGSGLLFVGLLLSLDPFGLLGVRAFLLQACTLIGAGLVVSAALVSALRRAPDPAPERAPDIDHWA